MKMMYGSVPVKNLNITKLDVSTNDADIVPSDIQAGKIGYAMGRKVIGTGKSFEFAFYGECQTNFPLVLPSMINVIEIGCVGYPLQLIIELKDMKNTNFAVEQTLGNIIIDGATQPLVAKVESNILTVSCAETVSLQVFYGKDNYV